MSLSQKSKYAIRIAIPVLIGLGVVYWLFREDLSKTSLEDFDLTFTSVLFLLAALLFVCGRDFGITWRYRLISNGDLSWKQALRVDLMCAFTSCVTPSAVGGSAMGMVYMKAEGISLGRGVILSMTTLFFDQMFIAVSVPIILLLYPWSDLFGNMGEIMTQGMEIVFWVVYAGMALWGLILFLGIVVCPHLIRKGLMKLFSIKFLSKWKGGVDQMTTNIINTSSIIKKQPARWWCKASLATITSWCSRFMVVNMLFLAFIPSAPQLIVFGRQFIMQIVLTISPTPGASGISEWIFTEYFGDLVGSMGVALIVALVWRLLSYYLYLIAGACLLPQYFISKKSSKEAEESEGKTIEE